jgi:hypothetical protein
MVLKKEKEVISIEHLKQLLRKMRRDDWRMGGGFTLALLSLVLLWMLVSRSEWLAILASLPGLVGGQIIILWMVFRSKKQLTEIRERCNEARVKEYALRESIEARGWRWQLWPLEPAWYDAHVFTYEGEHLRQLGYSSHAPTPLLALANAYMEALEK